MRYLGIDYGTKRIGLALSDEEGRIAFPYRTIENTPYARTEILEIAKREKTGKIIVGRPIPFSGGASKQTSEVDTFIEELKKISPLPVETENEVLTTKLARKSGVPKKRLDAASAALILQSHLDRHNV